jgi:hypothetical protein
MDCTVDTFEAQKRELLQPLLFEAGAGLMDCQAFEFGIALLLFHFARLGTTGLDSLKIEQILNNSDKKTAGQLVRLLRERLSISNGIDRALTHALAARNELVHRVLIDNVEAVMSEGEREKLVKHVRHLRRTVRAADQMLRPFVLALNEALDGVKQAEVEAEARVLFGRAATG